MPGIRRAYGHATLALRLPMWGGFDQWHSPIVDLPFVARHSAREAGEVREMHRRAEGAPPGARVVRRASASPGCRSSRWPGSDGWSVVTTAHALDAVGARSGRRARAGGCGRLRAGLRYEDLVRAADVVVTKPGYGIIAECIANDTAILYTDRGRFAEYDVLVDAMPRLPAGPFHAPRGSFPRPVAGPSRRRRSRAAGAAPDALAHRRRPRRRHATSSPLPVSVRPRGISGRDGAR
ncbi:MAG: hypothetical protein MZV64_42470 [Ignavibacteriales bacterium]|nr:hypothetical protein [Ignavibacteriales bacterium]